MKRWIQDQAGGWRSVVGLGLLLAGVTGCGTDEVPPPPLPGEEVFATMEGALPLDFVMEQFPDGGISPTMQYSENEITHGYLVDRYLVDGAMVDIVWLHDPAGGFPTMGDLRTQVNPVVFRAGLLDGWGWAHLDQRVAEWDIVDRSRLAELSAPQAEVEELTGEDGSELDGGADSGDIETSDGDSFSF